MDSFPEILTPNNITRFPAAKMRRLLAKLRSEITDLVLKGNENDYFDLDDFYRRFNVLTKDRENMKNAMVQELTTKGWKCKTSFGGTGLFVYSTEKPPSSCHEDGF